MVMIVLALSICTILREVASVLSFILTSSLGSTTGVEGSLLALLLLVGVNSSIPLLLVFRVLKGHGGSICLPFPGTVVVTGKLLLPGFLE